MDTVMSKCPSFSDLFTQLSERIQSDGLHISLSQEFGKLQSDIERIKFAYRLSPVQDVLRVHPLFKEKSSSESDELRIEGNLYFQKSNFKRALHLYTKSIIKAPGESKELPLAFANRSAVLYHIEHYRLCLQDIKEAMHNGYPEGIKYKLFDRKAKCLFQLGQFEAVRTAVWEAKHHVTYSTLSEEKKSAWVCEVEKKLNQNVGTTRSEDVSQEPHYNGPIPEPKDGYSAKFTCACPAFSIIHKADKGRYAVATRDISVGEVLVAEEPYAATLTKSYCITHCHWCFVRLVAPVPCHQCSGVVYCNSECRSMAWSKYHYAECNFLEFIHSTEIGLGHLSLRMVLTAGLHYLLEHRKKTSEASVSTEDTRSGFAENNTYESLDYHAAYSLVNHSKNRSIGDLFRRTATAILLLKLLENTKYFQDGDRIVVEEDRFYIGSQILRHIMMLPCNAHEISELVLIPNQISASQTQEIGSGLYNTLSLINHSCDPSVVRQSYGKHCVLRAIRPIPCGEEIADNYGALYALSTRVERNAHLSSQYYFECRCKACLGDWSQYFEIPNEYPVFKCDYCHGPVFIPSDRITENAVCSSCCGKQDITSKIVHFKESRDEYQEALKTVLEGEKLLECLPVLENHLELMDRTLCRPWRDYNDCQEAIKQIYNTLGNCLTQQS